MITDLQYIAKNGVILKGKLNQQDIKLRFKDILPFWDYANEDEFEGGTARVFGDKVLLTMLVASSQGGVVVLWNAKTGKIEHISDACYTVSVDMDDKYIYMLKDVFYWGRKATLVITRVPIGCMNAEEEGEELDTPNLPSPDILDETCGNCLINKQDNHIDIIVKDRTYSVEILQASV